MLIGIIGTLLGLLGVYGFFYSNITLIIIGGVAGIVINVLGLLSGQQKSLLTAIIAIIAGIIYATAAKISLWKGGLIGLTFMTSIAGLVGLILLANSNKK